MPHYAEIDPLTNIVKRVIVAQTQEWCEKTYQGVWERCYYDTPGKNMPSPGYEFIPHKKNFAEPQPFPSWRLDNLCVWQPPKKVPEDAGSYYWDEDLKDWVAWPPAINTLEYSSSNVEPLP